MFPARGSGRDPNIAPSSTGLQSKIRQTKSSMTMGAGAGGSDLTTTVLGVGGGEPQHCTGSNYHERRIETPIPCVEKRAEASKAKPVFRVEH